MPQYAPIFNLSSLNGGNGFRMSGVSAHDGLGRALAGIGDVNGDGFADLVLGVAGAQAGGADPGVSYVVFGAADGWGAAFDLASLNGANGFSLVGLADGDEAGFSVSGGDVNGDGFADLIIGAWNANRSGNTGAGETYVVFGDESGWPSSVNLSTLDGLNGFRLIGVEGDDNSGHSVAYAGDVNGDGYGDIIVGAYQAESVADTAYDNGHSYVVFGSGDGWGASLSLAGLDGSNGFRIDGWYMDQWSGYTVAGGGDINGDGFDDILIGAVQGGVGFNGETHVVFGAADGWGAAKSLEGLDGDNGFVITGVVSGGFTSRTLAIVGDVNADGYDDFIIGGAASADPEGRFNAGEAYLVFGGASGWTATFDLSTLDGSNGFRIIGPSAGAGAATVAAAGDFNGDGFADIIVAAPGADTAGDGTVGETYIIFGADSGFGSTFDLDAVDGNNGVCINGSGGAAANGGDINGDGIDDVIIGAGAPLPGDPLFGGSAHVVFGSRPGEAVTRTGTALDNRIFGGAFADTLSGLAGDDRLDGGGGDDAIHGGAGVDAAAFSVASTGASWARNVDGSWTVNAGAEGVDTLTSVEFLDFTDRDVFLDRAARTFSGNGTSDVLFRRSDGIMASWEVTGTTISAASFLPTAGAEWSALGTGDISGDGRDDVIWQRDDGLVYSWIMDGGFSAAVGLAGIGPEWSFLGLGDFNGDLTDDLAWQRNDGVVFIWQMNNSAIQSANSVTGLGAEWQIAGIGDFNSDGRDDFLWRNSSTGQSVVWHMNGSTIQGTGPTSEQAGLDWAIVGVGDTNGDGRDDVILQRASDGMIQIWAMDGTNVLSATDVAPADPAQWIVRGVGDYSGDGRDDILWQNDNGLVYVWLMNGASIQSAGALSGIGSEWGII